MNSRTVFSRWLVLTLGLVGIVTALSVRAADTAAPQYYELCVYVTKTDAQRQRVNDYWQQAAIPAYNRMGVQSVGVFTELEASATNQVYVLIPFDSLETFASAPAKLVADAGYQKAAAGFLDATKDDPAYDHMETSLLVAFDSMKHLVLPPSDKKPNVFELRTYMSPGEAKGLNKISMFEHGEIDVMKEVGLAPVFYGRKLVGDHMPCLVYMTCAESQEAHDQHWKAFGAHAVWKQLQADPQYKDNMVGMIRVMLRRLPASQI
ncbi:MAG TPA: NIPSNAP family protein [Dongiaceae bacterium]|nr:NIPSNAP family protein [Dongiaceae bacterium]